jgi:hypothetical protein
MRNLKIFCHLEIIKLQNHRSLNTFKYFACLVCSIEWDYSVGVMYPSVSDYKFINSK